MLGGPVLASVVSRLPVECPRVGQTGKVENHGGNQWMETSLARTLARALAGGQRIHTLNMIKCGFYTYLKEPTCFSTSSTTLKVPKEVF